MNGDIKPIEFMARREDWQNGISLYARQRTEGVGVVVAEPMEMRQHSEMTVIEPFIRIEIQQAQQLMDELWQCGLRPTEGAGSAGSLRATEMHLDDMRVIAFKKLNIDKQK
jgi:hypothetical protein